MSAKMSRSQTVVGELGFHESERAENRTRGEIADAAAEEHREGEFSLFADDLGELLHGHAPAMFSGISAGPEE